MSERLLKKLILGLVLFNLIFITIFNGVELKYYVFISMMLSFVIFVLFLFYVSKVHEVSLYKNSVSMWIFIFVMLVLVLTSKYRYASLVGFFEIFSGVINFFVVSSVLKEEDIKGFLIALSSIGTAFSLASIFEYFSYVFFSESKFSQFLVSNGFIQGSRVASFFQYPNATATYLLFFSLISLGLLVTDRSRKKSFFFVESVLMLFALYLTDSRGAYISILVGLILLPLFIKDKKRLFLDTLPVILVTGVLIFLNTIFFAPIVKDRAAHAKEFFSFISGGSAFSIENRIQLLLGSLNILKRYPIFGTGLNTFKDAILNYRVGLFYALDPHSLLARLLAETGVLGAGAFLLFILSVFWASFKEKTFQSDINIFIAIAFLVLFIHVNLDLSFQYLSIILLFFIALALAGSKTKVNAGIFSTDSFVLFSIAVVFMLFVIFLVPETIASIYATTGENYLQKGDIATANANFKVAVTASRYNAEYLTNLAETYEDLAMLNISREENISKAKDALGRAYKENKFSFYIPLRLSRLYLYSKDEKAVDFAQIALERNPLWAPIKADLALALAYSGKGNADEIDILAKDVLNFAATDEEYRAMHYITPSEKDSIVYTALGFVHIKEDKAKIYFTKALELDKENAFAYLGLSEIANLRKDILSEVEYLYSAVKINPCIEEAYNEYFAIAPLIKVETDLGKMSLKTGTTLEIQYSIVRNANLLDKIIAGVEVNGSIIEESEVKSNARIAYIKVPDRGPFVIFIKVIDKNGKEIVRVRSVPLNPE